MNFNKVANKRTICEVLREIHDITKDKPDVVALLEEATIMAKKMDAKLKEYKADWQETFYQKNTNIEKKWKERNP
jgi:hypothetical protein